MCKAAHRAMDGAKSAMAALMVGRPSRYLAMREGGSNASSDDFSRNAALIGIPLIAGLAIGAAVNDRNDRWDRRDYNRRHWNRGDRGR